MFLADHPPPHFHAVYQEHDAKINIDTLEIIEGYLPRRQLSLVRRWAQLHQNELRANWTLVEQRGKLHNIRPWE
jgi:hypothetical protein